jgi:hypothetical protein
VAALSLFLDLESILIPRKEMGNAPATARPMLANGPHPKVTVRRSTTPAHAIAMTWNP